MRLCFSCLALGAVFLAGLCAPFAVVAQTAVALPFETDFESGEGYTIGPLVSDVWWQFDAELDVNILTPGADSPQALGFSGADWFWLPLNAAGEPVTWIDFYIKPVFVEEDLLPEGIDSGHAVVTGFVKVDTEGEVLAVDGDGFGGGQWIASDFLSPFAADGESAFDWIRLTYRLDYFAKSWDLFIDGELQLYDLGFLNNEPTEMTEFAVVSDAETPTLLDYFYAGTGNPLFTDTAGDGLPDVWVIENGLDPVHYQRYADADLDGLYNLLEYSLGTSPTQFDTDGDGLDDGLEVLLESDPTLAESHALGTVPFSDGFEGDVSGVFVDGTRLWAVTGDYVRVVAESDAPEGLQYLQANWQASLSRRFNDPQSSGAVWIDLRIKVRYLDDNQLPDLKNSRVASAFYFGPDGRLRAFDGNGDGGGQWLSLEHKPAEAGTWTRLTVRHDYTAQTWSIWIDGVRYAQLLGFRDTVPAFSQIQIDQLNALDDVIVDSVEPAALDNDGDGLTNAQEVTLGIDPNNPDTSGDGMSDGDKVRLDLDPSVDDAFIAKLRPDAYGATTWGTFFTADEGYTPGPLSGQEGWQAENSDISGEATAFFINGATNDAFMERFLGGVGLSQIWVGFRAQMESGLVPATLPIELQMSAVFGYRSNNVLSVYNGSAQQWSDYPVAVDSSEWNDYAIFLDYVAETYSLYVNGQVVCENVPMVNPELNALSVVGYYQEAFNAGGGSGEPGFEIDALVVSTRQPTAADFDAGATGNFHDVDGNGLPDAWEFEHFAQFGVDPEADASGDGWTNLEKYQAGVSPTVSHLSALPFVETFAAHASGELTPGANNWLYFGGTPIVVSEVAHEGGAALLLPSSGDATIEILLANRIDAEGHPIVWTDVVMQPALFPASATPAVGEQTTVLFYFTEAGTVHVYDGTTQQWLSHFMGSVFDPETLTHISVRQDFDTQQWDLWINGEAVFNDLGFANPSPHYQRFSVLVASESDTLIDSVRVHATPPN